MEGSNFNLTLKRAFARGTYNKNVNSSEDRHLAFISEYKVNFEHISSAENVERERERESSSFRVIEFRYKWRTEQKRENKTNISNAYELLDIVCGEICMLILVVLYVYMCICIYE